MSFFSLKQKKMYFLFALKKNRVYALVKKGYCTTHFWEEIMVKKATKKAAKKATKKVAKKATKKKAAKKK
jgi:hypothetical protein